MREILFRGKRTDNGEWVTGYYVQKQDPLLSGVTYHYILIQERDNCECLMSTVSWYKVIPETVGQYTGLTDKNGKKIFEGDIVNFKTINYHFKNCRIKYQSCYARYCAIDNKGYEYPMDKTFEYEILGNIHDNPELLESEVDTE